MKLIYDIGAHCGSDTEFYLKKGFKVVAVEANPYACAIISERFAEYLYNGSLTLISMALCGEEPLIRNQHYMGEIKMADAKFIIHKNHNDWGTLNNTWNKVFGDDFEEIEVPCIHPKTLFNMFGPGYYTKIDIEGADAMCLKNMKGLELPPYISAELLTYNNILDKNVNCLEVINALLDLGYTKFQLVDQGKNHLVKCPFPALEGEYVDYEFDGYCSGLFGKELPDKWVGIEEIMLQYIHYFYRKPNCFGESLDDGSWFDIHCKIK